MKNIFLILLCTALFFNIKPAYSAEKCISGNSDKNNIIEQFEAAQKNSSITQIITEAYKLDQKNEAQADCPTGECSKKSNEDNTSAINNIANSIQSLPQAPTLLFKPECVEGSMQFKSDTNEISCPGGKSTKNQCLSNKVVNYQNAVISSFLNCAKKSGLNTISPENLYGMYSLETGFKPQYAYNGGVGAGQLTSIFVDDIHQKWRGFKLLEKIANSNLSECAAAKIIAQKDIQNKPAFSSQCNFVQFGEGLERNILYTLVGFANSWDKDISPKMKDYLKVYANDPLIDQVKDLTLLNAYGHGGRAAGRAIASRLSVFSKNPKTGQEEPVFSPKEYLKLIKEPLHFVNQKQNFRTLNIYTMNMAKRQKEIPSKLSEPLKTKFSQIGAKACINQ